MSEQNAVVTLTTKVIDTANIKITVAVPPENPQVKGYFTGKAIIRTKQANNDLFDRIEESTVEDDEAFVRELYTGFTGLGNANGPVVGDEESFQEVLTGPLSAYLVPAVIQAYYEQYGEARKGNFQKSRRR